MSLALRARLPIGLSLEVVGRVEVAVHHRDQLRQFARLLDHGQVLRAAGALRRPDRHVRELDRAGLVADIDTLNLAGHCLLVGGLPGRVGHGNDVHPAHWLEAGLSNLVRNPAAVDPVDDVVKLTGQHPGAHLHVGALFRDLFDLLMRLCRVRPEPGDTTSDPRRPQARDRLRQPERLGQDRPEIEPHDR